MPVCSSDANRLAAGEAPKMRMVRVGDRWVSALAPEESYFPDVVNHAELRNAILDGQGQSMKYGAMPMPNLDNFGSPSGM